MCGNELTGSFGLVSYYSEYAISKEVELVVSAQRSSSNSATVMAVSKPPTYSSSSACRSIPV